MVEFYKQTEDGEYQKATEEEYEEAFRERSDKIVAKRLKAAREKDRESLREEMESEIRKNVKDSVRKEVEAKIKSDYEKKLAESEKRANELDVKFRRKSIAAEYGFKPEAEEFLGDGDDDAMRAKADKLKDSFANKSESKSIDKESGVTLSKVQQETGIAVEV